MYNHLPGSSIEEQVLILFQICGSVGVNTVAAVSTGLSLIVLALRITLTYYFFLNISAHYFITVSIDRSSGKKFLGTYPYIYEIPCRQSFSSQVGNPALLKTDKSLEEKDQGLDPERVNISEL